MTNLAEEETEKGNTMKKGEDSPSTRMIIIGGSGGALWRRNWAMAPPWSRKNNEELVDTDPTTQRHVIHRVEADTKSHYTSTRTTTNGPASVPISPALPWSL